ncbi:MAG TPA: isoamylase early set domain-containing protein [Gemmatimonadaceae bacterium]|nr:isoamylase early set domain-containing protein [Gemmatimonadaceae bacterium]
MSEREYDPFIEEIAEELKRPVRFDSTFESRVMAAIEPAIEAPSSGRGVSTPWILRPRTFYVSPLAGLAVAAGLVAIITMSVLRTVPSSDLAANPATPETVGVPVTLASLDDAPVALVATPITYIDRSARTVAVVGNFNDWDATKNVLTLTGDSVWTGNIRLTPGRYEYQLVVDGKWIADPGAQHSAESEFGGTNSVMIVSPVPR